MKRKIKMGVLGCADIAYRLLIPNFISSDLFEITHVASRSEEKANEFAKKFNCLSVVGYEMLISSAEIEAVYIPLPTGLHYYWAKRALLAGKHIFVEKSLTQTYSQTEELLGLAREKNLCVFENFMFPYHQQVKFVHDLLDSNEIGELKLLRSCFGFPVFNVDSNIRYKYNLGGGALLDAGAYTLMAAQLFLGLKQEVIGADFNMERSEVDFQGSILLRNNHGVCSQLSFGFNNFYQNNIELWGTEGKITVERAFTAGPSFSPNVIVERNGCKRVHTLPPDNHFFRIIDDFHSCIINGNYDKKFELLLNQSRLIQSAQSFMR